MTLYFIQNHSIYIPIERNEIRDLQIDNNRTYSWKRSIIYTIKPISEEEYICIVIPDTLGNKDLLQYNNNRICRTRINIRNKISLDNNSSTVIFTRLSKRNFLFCIYLFISILTDQWDLIDIFIIILIVVSSLLFLISLILCLIARQYNKKRIVQIKPESRFV